MVDQRGARRRQVDRVLVTFSVGALLAACSSVSVPMPDNPSAGLKQAEALLQENKNDDAIAVLRHFDRKAFAGDEQARRDVMLAKAYHQSRDSWKAYKEIKKFSQDHPSSPTSDVSELHYEIGRYLLRSDGGFLFFYSDKARGRRILEDFLVYYSYTSRTPDVLQHLGESAFKDQDYELAQARYQELLANHPASEWVTLAVQNF